MALDQLNRWTKWVQELNDEVATLLESRHLYRGMQSIIESNPRLDRPSAFYPWFARNYAVTQVIAIRRLIDKKRGVRSLYRLIWEIKRGARIITRDDYRLLFPVRLREDGDAAFDRVAGARASSFPSAIARRDLEALEKLSDAIGAFVNKKVAHLAPDREKLALLRLSQLDGAIDTIERIFLRYQEMLCPGLLGSLEPSFPHDWRRIFMLPWIVRG